MAFECGFKTVSKFNSSTTICDLILANSYMRWESSNFPITFERYWEFNHADDLFPGIPDEKLVEYYSYTRDYQIGHWGTMGKILDYYIASKLKNTDDPSIFIGITNEFIDGAISWADNELRYYNLTPGYIKEAFVYTSEGEKEPIRCDGITIIRGNGTEADITLPTGTIYTTISGYDEDKIQLLESFKDALMKLKSVNLDTNLVWYYRKETFF